MSENSRTVTLISTVARRGRHALHVVHGRPDPFSAYCSGPASQNCTAAIQTQMVNSVACGRVRSGTRLYIHDLFSRCGAGRFCGKPPPRRNAHLRERAKTKSEWSFGFSPGLPAWQALSRQPMRPFVAAGPKRTHHKEGYTLPESKERGPARTNEKSPWPSCHNEGQAATGRRVQVST